MYMCSLVESVQVLQCNNPKYLDMSCSEVKVKSTGTQGEKCTLYFFLATMCLLGYGTHQLTLGLNVMRRDCSLFTPPPLPPFLRRSAYCSFHY